MGTLVYLICVPVASFAVLAQAAVAQGANTTLPLTYSGQVVQGDGSQTCHSEEQREATRSEVKNATQRLLRESVVPLLQTNLTQHPCGGSTGWRRAVYLNMSDPSQQCPSVWRQITTPHRTCGRILTSISGSCVGVNYTTGDEQYDQVCGRIIGYQLGTPDPFRGVVNGEGPPQVAVRVLTTPLEMCSITRCVGGLPATSWEIQILSEVLVSQLILTTLMESVSHMAPPPPRQHIWTFATGVDEQTNYPCCTCPCVAGSTGGSNIPSFVGQNYFCESGITQLNSGRLFWPDGDPLWDGQGCGPTSFCCTFNSPPWFNVRLPSSTTDDIEVRLCDTDGNNEDSPIQLVELYVK